MVPFVVAVFVLAVVHGAFCRHLVAVVSFVILLAVMVLCMFVWCLSCLIVVRGAFRRRCHAFLLCCRCVILCCMLCRAVPLCCFVLSCHVCAVEY